MELPGSGCSRRSSMIKNRTQSVRNITTDGTLNSLHRM